MGGVQGAEGTVGNLPDGGGHLEGVEGGVALAEGPVDLAGAVILERSLEGLPRGHRPCEQHEARGAPPQAVHGAGLGGPPPHQGQEGVLLELASAGQGGQAAGLGHGEQILIFKEDRRGQGHLGLDPGRTGPGDPLA